MTTKVNKIVKVLTTQTNNTVDIDGILETSLLRL